MSIEASAKVTPEIAIPMTLPRTVSVYRQLIEAAPDAMVVVDSEGVIILVNEHAERMFGYTSAEMLGSALELLIPERFGVTHEAHRAAFFQNLVSRPMGSGLELFARRRDGSEFPAEVSLSGVRVRDGHVAAAAIRDVSDRVRITSALRATEEKFRATFHSAGIGMALVSVRIADAGRIVDSNQALSQLTGHPRDTLLGTEISSLHEPDCQGSPKQAMASLLSGERRAYHYECRWATSYGKSVWVRVTSTIVANDSGSPEYCLYQVSDLSERKRLEDELRYQADHDALTGLLNRHRFLMELDRELAAAQRYDHDGAVMLLDLDHFKYVNDTFGHLAGDSLIKRTATVLRRRLRATDALARLGGDEFAVLLPQTDLADAVDVAAALLHEVRSELRAGLERAGRPVTASIGIAPFPVRAGVSGIDLLNEADIAMYDAKDAGGDRLAVYESSRRRHRQMNARLNLAHTIREALAHEDVVLRAQPIKSLRGDPRPRYELLLRIRDQAGDLIAPGVFLPVAERFDLARDVDEYVTQQAIDLLVAQRRAGHELSLAVNLSAQSIADDELLRLVATRLAATRIDPRSICFELTETAAVTNVDNARIFANHLFEIGCEFALDDFGSGYASFYYLKHIHFDYIKIDGEFVRGLAENEASQVIVKGVVQIARGLRKRTIAEFVEDEATLRRLEAEGVDYAQGYHVGPPGPIERLNPQVAPPAA